MTDSTELSQLIDAVFEADRPPTTLLSDADDDLSEEALDAVFDRCGKCNGFVLSGDGLCDACADEVSDDLDEVSDE